MNFNFTIIEYKGGGRGSTRGVTNGGDVHHTGQKEQGTAAGRPGRAEHDLRQGVVPNFADAALQTLQESLGGLDLGKKALLGLELGRVHAAPAAAEFHRMLEVQHLVVQQVLEGKARHARVVEDAADHDGVVGGI